MTHEMFLRALENTLIFLLYHTMFKKSIGNYGFWVVGQGRAGLRGNLVGFYRGTAELWGFLRFLGRVGKIVVQWECSYNVFQKW